jgi:hypothetical protein
MYSQEQYDVMSPNYQDSAHWRAISVLVPILHLLLLTRFHVQNPFLPNSEKLMTVHVDNSGMICCDPLQLHYVSHKAMNHR